MKAFWGLLFLGLILSSFAQDKSAPIDLHNVSLKLYQAGNGVLERTFALRSRAGLQPRKGEPGVYEADYVVFESGKRAEQGRIVVNIPAIDSDSNGVPDIVQLDKSVDAAVTGVITPHFVAAERLTLSEFTGRISREANRPDGEYSFNLYADGSSAAWTLRIFNGFGSITYERGGHNKIWINTDEVDGKRLIANTSFRVINENEVVIRPFVARSNDKRALYSRIKLHREGNSYIGLRVLRDRRRLSLGEDYRRALIRIVDAHDGDGDGIPDLSDLDDNRPSYIGNVLTWGYLSDGLIDVPLAATNIMAIAAGGGHSLALKADGKLFAWGRNDFGQVAVPSSATDVVAIAAGTFHSLAAKADGTVIGCGLNESGQTKTQSFPAGVVALAAGTYHSLALTRDGQVYVWGYVGWQIPTVPFAATNVTAIAANSHHNIALRADGTVVTWGVVYNGNSYGPATPPPGLNDLKMVAAGVDFGLGLRSNGTVVAWGYMYDGTNGNVAASVPVGLSNVVFIAAGSYHSLAITSAGDVVSWGWNNLGCLPVPSSVTNVEAVAVGTVHSIAITTQRSVHSIVPNQP